MTAGDGVPALRADGLGKSYGREWALRDCTFSVPAGAVVGLVGPNGAGKTTLLSLTVGLLAATEGEIAVFGQRSRLEFMRDVMAACADTGLTVVIASHVISELERLCDWLLVLGQLAQAMRPDWRAEPVSFEQLLIAYLQRPARAAQSAGLGADRARAGDRSRPSQTGITP